MAKHISTAVTTFEDFDKQLEGYVTRHDKLALMLDFDGTLTDIDPVPVHSILDEEVRDVLRDLAKHPNINLTLISGRILPGLKEKVGIPNIVYSGEHGFQIEYPDGTGYNYEVPKEVRDNFPKLIAELKEKCVYNGSWVENKDTTLTFQYRNLPEELRPETLKKVAEIITKYKYRCSEADLSLEAKPAVDWDKGYAAKHILEHEFGKNYRDKIKIIFAGDDNTDEDIMKVIDGYGRSYRITRGLDVDDSVADFKIHGTGDVFMLLKWLKRLYYAPD